MTRSLRILPIALIAQVVLTGSVSGQGILPAQSRESGIIQNSSSVLAESLSTPLKGIPRSMLSDAKGVVIVPSLIKLGFIAGVRHGRGVLLIRDDNGVWQAPQFVTMTGGSVGWQAGIASNDIILVFKTRQSVQNLVQGRFTIGVDAAAAAGPVGRRAEAGTDGRLSAELYSYSRSRGLFVGVSVDGAVLQVDHSANASYYASGRVPQEAVQLATTLMQYSGGTGVVSGQPQPQPQPQPGVTPGAPLPSYPPPNQPQPGTITSPDNLQQRTDLANAWQQLSGLLDDTWTSYLALPPEVFAPAAAAGPSAKTLQQSLMNYEAVARDTRYQLLANRPEFQQTHRLLKLYFDTRAAVQSKLDLPSPPTSRPRY